jgi:hypothetical protein
MRLNFVCLILSITVLQFAKAQDSAQSPDTGKQRYYKVKLFLTRGGTEKGYLMGIHDSAVYVSEVKSHYGRRFVAPDPLHKNRFRGDTALDKNNFTINRFDPWMLESIRVTNTKARTWTIVGCTVAGIIIGAAIGVGQGSDQGLFALDAAAKGVALGVFGGAIGVLVGVAVANAADKKYLINGSWESLEELKAELKY